MRLYLSSFRLGNHADRLVQLAGPRQRTAVVCNAMDAQDAVERAAGVERELAAMSALGFDPVHVDLRTSSDSLADGFDVIWMRGGNVFVLRRLLADTGADRVLLELLAQDAVVYGGYSAGVCVLGTDLAPLAQVDDIAVVPDPLMQGLGVLDYVVVPHVNTPEHPESANCTAVAADLARRGVPHLPMRDGQVLLVDGSMTERLP